MNRKQLAMATSCLTVIAFTLTIVLNYISPTTRADHTGERWIVQARSASLAAELVREKGGSVTHRLGVIRAVGATLTAAAAREQPCWAKSPIKNRTATWCGTRKPNVIRGC